MKNSFLVTWRYSWPILVGTLGTLFGCLPSPAIADDMGPCQMQPQKSASSIGRGCTDKEKALAFRRGDAGEIRTQEGVRLSFTQFTAPDGCALMSLSGSFKSVHDAREYFSRRVQQAHKVIKLGKKKSAGHVVGERAEVVVRPQPKTISYTFLWTAGAHYHEISSQSTSDLAAFEAAYFP